MKITGFFLAVACLFFFISFPTRILPKSQPVIAVEKRASDDSTKKTGQNVRIVFWNVENLYDPYDDTTTLDNEFTAEGVRHWSFSRFRRKLNHVAKTLLSIGGWEPPAVIGLCEVENRYVMNKLIYETPLKTWKYRFIHHESPDMRGIDVALLYRPDLFHPLYSRSISIRFPFDTLARTREILMVSGTLGGGDTITFFVNHWPSRRGGTKESEPRRNHVAMVLRQLIDSLQWCRQDTISSKKERCRQVNILVMGDFNDEPFSRSLLEVLKARSDTGMAGACDLVNLMAGKVRQDGSHKFRGIWALLDQFIATKTLVMGSNRLKVDLREASVYRPSFLLEEDPSSLGSKPGRTFNGPRYSGGFSDHLPVFLTLRW